MERELILTAKNERLTEEYIEAEKRIMAKLFPYIESFKAFTATNEVFDITRSKLVTKVAKLLKVYHRLTPAPFNFVISKN
jgi:hypothetical protein